MDLVRVTKSGCHEWLGSRFESGYARIKIAGLTFRMHRVAWELANGPIAEGLIVCHHCDNPPCVRLDHLFLGTPKDNVQDMRIKGRGSDNSTRIYSVGEAHFNSKLSDMQVAEIRERYDQGDISQAFLAGEYDVSQALVSQIVRGLHRVGD